MSIALATALGVADGVAVTPIPVGTIAKPCAEFQLILWDAGAFSAKLQLSPNGGTTWVDYFTAKTGSVIVERVFIGEGIKARLTNASGTVSAILVPLP